MNSSDAKTEILDSIRRNLAASAPFDAIREAHHAEKDFAPKAAFSGDYSVESLIESFKANLESVAGNCAIVADEEQAAEVLQSIVEQTGAKKIAVSDSFLIKLIVADLTVETLENASPEELFECDLGVTGAQFGVAETGTLVLESEKESNRLTSLVPPVHVCILRAQQIRYGLGEVLKELKTDLSRAVTFITGASRTSDIELTLAIGVHGPGELFVILINEK